MSDKEKDGFTFDENDDFPEDDLSGIFPEDDEETAEAEGEDENQLFAEPATEEPPADQAANRPLPPEEEPSPSSGGGGSRTRLLLLILVLVMAAAAGLYYMRLPEESSFETEAVQTGQQVVAVPAPQPAGDTAAEEAGEDGAAAPAAEPTAEPSATEPTTAEPAPAAAGEQAEPDAGAVEEVIVAADEQPAAVGEQARAAAEPGEEPAVEAAETQAELVGQDQPSEVTPTAPAAPAAAPAADQARFVLDAGAFLFPAQREEIKKKINALGYEPRETEVKASVRLTRLGVGAFAEQEVAAKLAEVRRIAPDAFSIQRDGEHVIYAGSFANQDNVQRLSARLREAGFEPVEEAVKVEKVLSRIRFGAFTDDAAAEKVAQQAEEVGIPARVVEP